MKYYYFLLLALVCFSCKKKENITVNYRPSYDPSLRVSHQENDSTFTISWDKYTGKDFKSYKLIYIRTMIDYYIAGDYEIWEKEFTSADGLSFQVGKLSKTMHHSYILQVNLNNVANAYLDTLEYIRTGTAYLPMNATDALIDRGRKIVYLVDQAQGRILKANYETGTELDSISLKSPLGQCAIASYGGILNELYAPTRDGFVFILDAETMAIKERVYVKIPYPQIPFAGDSVFYVNSTLPFYSSAKHPFYMYNRTTLTPVTMGDYFRKNARMHYLGGPKKHQFLEVRMVPNSPAVKWYGGELSEDELYYLPTNDLSADILCPFPGGEKYISGTEGYILDNIFRREGNLPGTNYTNFTLNENTDAIFAARADTSKIILFSYPALTQTNAFKTRLLPSKMFLDGKQLICITRTHNFSPRAYSFIEKVDLP